MGWELRARWKRAGLDDPAGFRVEGVEGMKEVRDVGSK